MATTFKEFSQSLNHFYEGNHDKEIKDLTSMLEVVKDYFFKQYDDISDNEFSSFKGYGITGSEKKQALRSDLESRINTLDDFIVGSSNPSMDFEAFKKLYEFFFDNGGNIKYSRMVKVLPIHTDFYRMRSATDYKVYKRNEIFQISGENRKLTSKLRFSDDGHPCLYLGSSLYIAWEEVRRPSFETVNFARFRNTTPLRVLDLTVRSIFKNWVDFVMSYLCLITSAKVVDEDKYKFRYEVSGLLMKLVQNSIARKGDVDGIKYVSSRQFNGKDIEIKGRSIMEAYVFPPKEYKEADVDDWLRDTFEMTEPRTTFLYNIHQIRYINPRKAMTSDYMDTLFFQLEELLKKEKVDKCKEKID